MSECTHAGWLLAFSAVVWRERVKVDGVCVVGGHDLCIVVMYTFAGTTAMWYLFGGFRAYNMHVNSMGRGFTR